MKPKVMDLFAGCGGFSYGFAKSGFEITSFVEIWQPAIDTFLKNHPNTKHLGYDITKIKNSEIEKYRGKIDLIIGGPPCQGFSMAGKRNPDDKRNQLYKEFLRFVKIIEPKVVVIENVKGILSMNDLDNEKVINKIIHELIKNNYFISYKLLNSSDYCVPQNSERVVLIAKKMDLFPKENNAKVSVIDSVMDLPYEANELNGHLLFNPTKEIIKRIKNLNHGERLSSKFNFSRMRIHPDKPSPTVSTKPLFIHPIYDRLMTPRELARLQSFPDSFEFTGSKTAMVKQIGNAVPPLMAEVIASNLRRKMQCEE